jgi:hypothetical protein
MLDTGPTQVLSSRGRMPSWLTGEPGATGLAAALCVLGGIALWQIVAGTSAGAGAWPTALLAGTGAGWAGAARPVARALVPFAAGPAVLGAAWAMLALWRCGRRVGAALGLLGGAGALLLALAVGRFSPASPLVPLLAVVTPLVLAGIADVAVVGFLGRPSAGRLAAATGLAVVGAALGLAFWPVLLGAVVLLVPVAFATPVLAAGVLTGGWGRRPVPLSRLIGGLGAPPLALAAGFWLMNAGALRWAAGGLLTRAAAAWLSTTTPLGLATRAAVLLVTALCLGACGLLLAGAFAGRGEGPVPSPDPEAGARRRLLQILTEEYAKGRVSLPEYEAQLKLLLRPGAHWGFASLPARLMADPARGQRLALGTAGALALASGLFMVGPAFAGPAGPLRPAALIREGRPFIVRPAPSRGRHEAPEPGARAGAPVLPDQPGQPGLPPGAG